MIKLSVKNFRGLGEVEFTDRGNVSMIVGDNESGKTSLAAAIEYAFCAQALGVRGKGVKKLLRRGAKSLSVKVSFPSGFEASRTTTTGRTLEETAAALGTSPRVLPLIFPTNKIITEGLGGIRDFLKTSATAYDFNALAQKSPAFAVLRAEASGEPEEFKTFIMRAEALRAAIKPLDAPQMPPGLRPDEAVMAEAEAKSLAVATRKDEALNAQYRAQAELNQIQADIARITSELRALGSAQAAAPDGARPAKSELEAARAALREAEELRRAAVSRWEIANAAYNNMLSARPKRPDAVAAPERPKVERPTEDERQKLAALTEELSLAHATLSERVKNCEAAVARAEAPGAKRSEAGEMLSRKLQAVRELADYYDQLKSYDDAQSDAGEIVKAARLRLLATNIPELGVLAGQLADAGFKSAAEAVRQAETSLAETFKELEGMKRLGDLVSPSRPVPAPDIAKLMCEARNWCEARAWELRITSAVAQEEAAGKEREKQRVAELSGLKTSLDEARAALKTNEAERQATRQKMAGVNADAKAWGDYESACEKAAAAARQNAVCDDYDKKLASTQAGGSAAQESAAKSGEEVDAKRRALEALLQADARWTEYDKDHAAAGERDKLSVRLASLQASEPPARARLEEAARRGESAEEDRKTAAGQAGNLRDQKAVWDAYDRENQRLHAENARTDAKWQEADKLVKLLKAEEENSVRGGSRTFMDNLQMFCGTLFDGRKLDIDEEGGLLVDQTPASLLSGSAQWRLTACVSAAIARQCNSPLLLLDGVDVLDNKNRANVVNFVLKNIAPHFEHVLMTATPRNSLEDEVGFKSPKLTKWILRDGALSPAPPHDALTPMRRRILAEYNVPPVKRVEETPAPAPPLVATTAAERMALGQRPDPLPAPSRGVPVKGTEHKPVIHRSLSGAGSTKLGKFVPTQYTFF